MKRMVIAALALASCSQPTPDQPTPANVAQPASSPYTTSPEPQVQGGGMRGEISDLNADISGLNVRTSDTRVIVDLPADTLFEFDRADLTPAAAENLTKVADLIRQAPAGTIEVIGHTDAKGDDAYNLQLSELRAQSVVNWMREQVGVRQRAFQAIGKGEAEPVAPNMTADGKDDPVGRAANRRVVVSIPR